MVRHHLLWWYQTLYVLSSARSGDSESYRVRYSWSNWWEVVHQNLWLMVNLQPSFYNKHHFYNKHLWFVTTCSDDTKTYMFYHQHCQEIENHIGFGIIKANGDELERFVTKKEKSKSRKESVHIFQYTLTAHNFSPVAPTIANPIWFWISWTCWW